MTDDRSGSRLDQMTRAQQITALFPKLTALDGQYTALWDEMQGLFLEKKIGGAFAPIIEHRRRQLKTPRKMIRENILGARTTLLSGGTAPLAPLYLSDLQHRFAGIESMIQRARTIARDLTELLGLVRSQGDIGQLMRHAEAFWTEHQRAQEHLLEDIPHRDTISSVVVLEQRLRHATREIPLVRSFAGSGAPRAEIEAEVTKLTKAIDYTGRRIQRVKKELGY
ncbi:MAG: hypothetical protein G01um10148_772 [Parcubacteria group bacterium Gr01-1014_8]|nr:MAG: hypothetical protein G01um10148_772 [Parcubacteria group bacterium Gr01-1014_8]